MSQQLIDIVEKADLKPNLPEFRVGDTVDVQCRIREGEKTRIQTFNGVVIARGGRGINASFKVRRIVANEGVERTFPLHSPNVVDVKVLRRGRTRRAKLFYLRDRVGKARKLRELRTQKKAERPATAQAEPELAASGV